MSTVTTIEPRPAPLAAGARPTAIVPQTMEEAYRLAKAVCAAQMAPKGLDTPEKALIAIMHGLEIGMTPMAALQRIAVVNGRPTIWGDAAMALVRGSGVCEWVKERIEGDGNKMIAVCEAKRRGETEPIIGRFSVADASTAGLWDKTGPWKQYPKRMLQMRARAFCLRDGFADVLGGLYLKEEFDGTQAPERRAPEPDAPMIEHAEPQEPPAPAPQIAHERRAPAPPAPTLDYESVRKQYEEAAKAATTNEELNAVWNRIVEAAFDNFLPPDQDDILRMHRMRSAELDQGE